MIDASMQKIRDLLQKALEGEVSEVSLQNAVDSIIINDNIPSEVSEEDLSELYRLQTMLELIAEHQSTSIGTADFYSREKIIFFLSDFSKLVK